MPNALGRARWLACRCSVWSSSIAWPSRHGSAATAASIPTCSSVRHRGAARDTARSAAVAGGEAHRALPSVGRLGYDPVPGDDRTTNA